MNPNTILESISEVSRQLPRVFQDMHNASSSAKDLFASDLFVMGVVSRNMSLADALHAMYEQRNFLTAAALLRLNIDTAARLWGASLAPNFEHFCHAVITGKRIDKLKDRSGKRMHDSYLVSSLEKISPGAKAVYEKASGFIHLSAPHIHGMVGQIEDNGQVMLWIGPNSPAATEKNWIDLASAFLHFSKLILGMLERYSELRTVAHASNHET